ncbi:hypothetical protein GCM10009616_29870 [Microlunatus lacustris]
MTDPQHPSPTPDPQRRPEPAAGPEYPSYPDPAGGYGGQPGYGQDYPQQDPGQGYAPQAYGQPGYGVSAQPYGSADHPQGTLILVFGIAGFFVGVLGPVAWIMGSRALREIRSSGAHPGNEQLIVIGRLLGIVVTVLMVLGILAFLLLFAVALAASSGA